MSEPITREYFEERIFGYVDTYPPITGSLKEKELTLSMKLYGMGVNPDDIVDLFRPAIVRMNAQLDSFVVAR